MGQLSPTKADQRWFSRELLKHKPWRRPLARPTRRCLMNGYVRRRTAWNFRCSVRWSKKCLGNNGKKLTKYLIVLVDSSSSSLSINVLTAIHYETCLFPVNRKKMIAFSPPWCRAWITPPKSDMAGWKSTIFNRRYIDTSSFMVGFLLSFVRFHIFSQTSRPWQKSELGTRRLKKTESGLSISQGGARRKCDETEKTVSDTTCFWG